MCLEKSNLQLSLQWYKPFRQKVIGLVPTDQPQRMGTHMNLHLARWGLVT